VPAELLGNHLLLGLLGHIRVLSEAGLGNDRAGHVSYVFFEGFGPVVTDRDARLTLLRLLLLRLLDLLLVCLLNQTPLHSINRLLNLAVARLKRL
jgi:hypothetical protein